MANPDATSDAEDHQLSNLLTWLMTAVSQQFFHMLILGRSGRKDLVARVREVDDQDFPNAMQIIDLMLKTGASVSIAPHRVAPANSAPVILRTELAFEQRLQTFLASCEIESVPGRERLAVARAPRDDYRAWLASMIQGVGAELPESGGKTAFPDLYPLLLQLMEQTLLHAFANWHEGQTAEASTSWQISGAAMLYLTALAPFVGSDDPMAPGLDVPGSTIVEREKRFEVDLQLTRRCAQSAGRLSEASEDAKLRRISRSIAEDCERLMRTKNGGSIEATLGSSKVFQDFRRARNRMES